MGRHFPISPHPLTPLARGVIFMRVRSLTCHGVYYCTFWSFGLLFWLFLLSADCSTLLFLDMEVNRGSVSVLAVKDEVAGDSVSLDVQHQKHENLSKQRHFFWMTFEMT